MAATPAVAALEQAGVDAAVHRYPHDRRSTDYGAEAVEAMADLGIPAERILKTLVVEMAAADGVRGLAVAVVPVPEKLSLKAVAKALSAAKVTMADTQKVTRTTGYVIGGVSPVGQKSALPTVIDESALIWDTVLCSAGRRGLEIELAPADLVAVTGAVVADITASAGGRG